MRSLLRLGRNKNTLTISEYSNLIHAIHKNRIGWSNYPIRSRGGSGKTCLKGMFLACRPHAHRAPIIKPD